MPGSMKKSMKKSRTLVDLRCFQQEHLLESESYVEDFDGLSGSTRDSFIQRPLLRCRSSSDGKLGLIIKEFECLADCCQQTGDNPMDKLQAKDQSAMKISSEQRPLPWNVGKISIFLLVFFSVTDIIINLVDAQMASLEAPDHYDALSADVIRPAFRYHTASSDKNSRKPRLGLGSAAISSVTNTLSPILPFAGGVDLRREDYWSNGFLGSMTSVIDQVRDAFSGTSSSSVLNTPRGGDPHAKTHPNSSKKRMQPDFSVTLSTSEPFVPVRDIADLTLNDISMAFRYAIENTRHDFNGARFASGLAPRVKKLFDKMSASTQASRGTGVQKPVTGLMTRAGDIDALEFCAAMRIFAEWRVLRQVPDGYKGYAVGMNLGQKDVVQNVAKIEQAVHTYTQHHANSALQDDVLKSPTLRELLQFEIDTNIQDKAKLPRLKEKSAAMGLLWVRRQLHYQTALFAKVMHVPDRFETARDAVTAAYKEVYDKYHGWAVQKIFSYSFQAAPDAVEVYKVMNPRKLNEITESAKSIVNAEQKIGDEGRRNKNKENPFEKIGGHFVREWEKAAGAVTQLFGHSPKQKVPPMRGGFDSADSIQQAQIEEYINQEISKDAHEHISSYLTVANPILSDLATLFDELNMDDPTKV